MDNIIDLFDFNCYLLLDICYTISSDERHLFSTWIFSRKSQNRKNEIEST